MDTNVKEAKLMGSRYGEKKCQAAYGLRTAFPSWDDATIAEVLDFKQARVIPKVIAAGQYYSTRETDSELLNDLKKLNGLPPYHDPGNIVRGDGYFAKSLEQKYGGTINELEDRVGFKQKRAQWVMMVDEIVRMAKK